MTSIDQQIDLVINRLKRAQYEDLYQQGKIDETQLYLITDDPDISSVVLSYLSGYYLKSETSSAAEISSADAANRAYVDSQISNIDVSSQLSGYVKLSSDSLQKLSGNLEIDGDITVGSVTAIGTQSAIEWGRIVGDLTAQSDLKMALDQKASASQIPTKTSQLQNDSGFLTAVNSISWEKVTGRPDGEWMTLSGTYDDKTTFSFDVWKKRI